MNWNPGIAPVELTPEPLGTEGEMSPGPDELNPAVPEQRVELEDRGFLPQEDTQDMVSDVAEPGLDNIDPKPVGETLNLGLENVGPDLPRF